MHDDSAIALFCAPDLVAVWGLLHCRHFILVNNSKHACVACFTFFCWLTTPSTRVLPAGVAEHSRQGPEAQGQKAVHAHAHRVHGAHAGESQTQC
eukprot:1161066-Pelagomonas_calceolata.AAC.12